MRPGGRCQKPSSLFGSGQCVLWVCKCSDLGGRTRSAPTVPFLAGRSRQVGEPIDPLKREQLLEDASEALSGRHGCTNQYWCPVKEVPKMLTAYGCVFENGHRFWKRHSLPEFEIAVAASGIREKGSMLASTRWHRDKRQSNDFNSSGLGKDGILKAYLSIQQKEE